MALTKLADVLSNRDKLPKKEPAVYSGNVFDFPTWINSFKVLVEDNYPDFSDRLYYLGKYTAGDAKDSIKGMLAVNSEASYVKARSLLQERYGDKFRLAQSFRDKIDSLPEIKPGDGKALEKLADFMLQCETAMGELSHLGVLNDPEEYEKILLKLPKYLRDRWFMEVDKWLYGPVEVQSNSVCSPRCHDDYPPFSVFCFFVQRQARIARNPMAERCADTKGKPQHSSKPNAGGSAYNQGASSKDAKKPQIGSFATSGAPESGNDAGGSVKRTCAFCKDAHRLHTCEGFAKLKVPERVSFVKKNGLCLGCLSWGHLKRDCKYKKSCDTCKGLHPTLLHDPDFKPRGARSKNDSQQDVSLSKGDESTQPKINSNCIGADSGDCSSLIVPVIVQHRDNVNDSAIVYALLDEQSDACFVTDSVLEKIGVEGDPCTVRLTTVATDATVECKQVRGLAVRGLYESQSFNVPVSYTRGSIPARLSQVPRPEMVKQWSHLEAVSGKLAPFFADVEIGLLIGLSCLQAIKPLEVLPGDEADPYGVRTALGWGVVGMCPQGSGSVQGHHFAFKTQVTEVSPQMVLKMFDVEFCERAGEETVSVEDKKFLRKLQSEICQLDDSHFELPLPFREENLRLPNNRAQALKRLGSLKNKMDKNPQFKEDYTQFMNEMIDKGFCERVPADECNLEGSVWYLSHHGIYHPHKPGRIRVVFDCSAEFQGEVLNEHLLQGPDLTNNLVGVLLRFRKESVAVVCDVQSFFNMVKVKGEHRNFLRFLWWDGGGVVEYRMTRHLFGARSSPGCASFALRSTADKYESECGSKAADFLRTGFYVDDGLTSVKTTEDGKSLVRDSREICKKGGFNLRSFLSNDREVMLEVPVEARAKGAQELNLLSENLPTERTLGLEWCVQSDSFQFRVVLKDKPLTRRGILSTVSSIFDPLGLIAPYILSGRRILQSLCNSKLDWDDPVPHEVSVQWEKWRSELLYLAKLDIQRCYHPHDFGEVVSAQLHHFSDASLEPGGLGQCSYLKLTDDAGNVSISLVMGKSRVIPLKPVTVPRLELTAAVVSVRVGEFLDKNLKYKEIEHFYYTDSKVVLGYISNESRKFHIYVANRVERIKESTTSAQWHHVDTRVNPADIASRGMSAMDLINSKSWWNGPDFLREKSVPTPLEEGDVLTVENDPEVKRTARVLDTKVTDIPSMSERFKRFSSWYQLKKAVAWCLRYKDKLKEKVAEGKKRVAKEGVAEKKEGVSKKERVVKRNEKGAKKTGTKAREMTLSVEDLQRAETVILRVVQAEAFKGKMMNLRPLDPIHDEEGLLRVGGRIERAKLPDRVKHPVLVPRYGHVTELIISHFHGLVFHGGRSATLNSSRQAGFWIVGARGAVTMHIMKCVVCRKLRGAVCLQKMADLPADRVDPAAPFTYCGVDYFGHFLVKEGRKELKRWGVLFTCMSSRAIHIETANSMNTSSFLNAYRRFIARRGPVRVLRCDQGSNFIGGRNELQQAVAEMNHSKIRSELGKDNCDWVVIEPNKVAEASHFGGVWERMIRSTRDVLSSIMLQHPGRLDDELLRTFLAEAEAVVNSRPLSYIDTKSGESPEPLSPNQLLTLKPAVVAPPPGKFVREDVYSRKRWRTVQYLADQFWSRWRSEVLLLLQERSKWNKVRRNLGIDDIVVVMDDDVPRNQWPLARVSRVYPSEDGLVRKVQVVLGRTKTTLERPISKLILLIAREFPDGELADG